MGQLRNSTNEVVIMTKLTLKSVVLEYIKSVKALDNAQSEIDDIREGRSQHLLAVAKTYKKVDTFIAACLECEESLKNSEKLDKMPRAWINAKSVIKKALQYQADKRIVTNDDGIKKELKLSDYDTESSLRKAVFAISKADKEGDSVEGPDTGAAGETQLQGDLQIAVQTLLQDIHKVAQELGEEAALGAVQDAITEVEALLIDLVPEVPILEEMEEVA